MCQGGGSSSAGRALLMSPTSLPWISASEPQSSASVENPGWYQGSGFAMEMGSRLRSLPAAGLNPGTV